MRKSSLFSQVIENSHFTACKFLMLMDYLLRNIYKDHQSTQNCIDIFLNENLTSIGHLDHIAQDYMQEHMNRLGIFLYCYTQNLIHIGVWDQLECKCHHNQQEFQVDKHMQHF